VKFECGWKMANSPLPDWLRPDLAQVMVLPALQTWNGLPVDVAVPVGPRIPAVALDWLKQHALQARRPLLFLEQLDSDGMQRMQDAIAFGPPAFQAEMARRLAAGEQLW